MADRTLVASLVLGYVDDPRDRLALEGVSSAWRAAGHAPRSWAPRETLVLTAPLAGGYREQALELSDRTQAVSEEKERRVSVYEEATGVRLDPRPYRRSMS